MRSATQRIQENDDNLQKVQFHAIDGFQGSLCTGIIKYEKTIPM